MGVHCFAHFENDVTPAIPYLNAVLGGFEYIDDPPTLTLRSQGKLIAVHGDKAAINALKDEHEARKIVEWLKNEINTVWARRDEIEPDHCRRFEAEAVGHPQAASQNELQKMRATHLYGLRGPGG